MLTAAIIGQSGKTRTANLVSSIFSTTGQKVSIIHSSDLAELDFKVIRNYMSELVKNGVHILILKINLSDMMKEVFNNIHFDIMIYTDKADDILRRDTENYSEIMRKIFSRLDQKGIVIANVDDDELVAFLQGMKCCTVTYGFNSKASITTSSVGDTISEDNFMCCLQRTISTRNGQLVEPQEYRIRLEPGQLDAYNVLAAASFALVNGVDLNTVNPFMLKM